MTQVSEPPGMLTRALLLLLLLTCASPILAQDLLSNGESSTPAALEYLKAKDYYYLLVRDEHTQSDRQNWLNAIKDFQGIYQNDPKGELAPNCLFMMAKMYYRMFMRFHVQKDLELSLANYHEIWTSFPENTLADDALFWSGEIHLKDKENPVEAAKFYTTQVEGFPQGDKYFEAVSRLREIDAKHHTGLPSILLGENAYDSLVKVLPVKYWSSDDYSRIVIRASGPVRYTSTLADQQEHKPRRLDIDFVQSTIEPQFAIPIAIKDGLLNQIHSSQYNPTTVRVSLDIEGISSYKIFSLNDPFRVIVDIHGPQTIIATPKTLPDFRQERIASTGGKEEGAPDSTPTLRPAWSKSSMVAGEQIATEKGAGRIVILDDKKKKEPLSSSGKDGLSLAQQLGLGVRRIVIDPGHGGKDPGAMAHGMKEKDITLKVAQKVAATLRDIYKYEVILTRTKDISLPLEERTALANTSNADLFISIHVNAHPRQTTSGIETFFLNLATNTEAMRVAARENATSSHNISDLQDILSDLMQNSKIQESSILAEYVQKKLISGLQGKYSTRDLGVKQAPFYVLIGAEMPAILAEISFISNRQEAQRLSKDTYLNEIASQIAAGVAGYVEHQATAALQL